MDIEEIYKPILNFEKEYLISNLGNIKSLKTDKLRKPYKCKTNGYYHIHLFKYPKSYYYSIHYLVISTFSNEIPKDIDIIDHIDGNKLNNNINNLRYVSFSENTNNAYKNNENMKKRLRKVYKYDTNNLIKTYNSISECKKDNNIDKISKISLSKIYENHYYLFEEKDKIINNIFNLEIDKLKNEEFKIIGKLFDNTFNNYSISNYGRILNHRTKKLMKSLKKKDEYEKIILIDDNKVSKKIFIHRIVAYKFISEYDNNKIINHLDENKQNNYYKNLEITTHKDNLGYSNNKKICKYDLEMNLIKKYNSITEAVIELKIKQGGNITKCCNNKLKKAYKFIWRYDN